ncbi:MAG: type II secretion system F family protein [Gammaproteobacteria bacterium]|nr:type II secretion system F family protein [Gammaproteobacteria bacterium]MDH3411084.1 type II secretion system F family protein [Gammaproteobacteria bacterium]
MAIETQSIPLTQAKPLSQSLLRWPRGKSRVSTRERIVFTERLSLLLETGVALHEALTTLVPQIENPHFADIIQQILDDVSGGKPMSEALSRHPAVFPGTYVNLVAAGERGGFMGKVLLELVALDESQEKLRGTIVSALTYPAFLILFSVAVVIFVLVAVFPKFEEMFAQIRNQLPVTTLILMGASNVLRHYWIALVGGLGAGVYLFMVWAKRPASTAWIDRVKLRIPFAQDIFIQIYMTKLLRVMSLSLISGVPVLDTIKDCRSVINNAEFEKFMGTLENKVNAGEGIAIGFVETPFIPPMVQQMVSTAEASGRLGQVMGRIADFYVRELNKKLDVLAKLAEPVMLLVMGAVVGLLVSSLILPIFQLSRAVQ